MSSSPYSPTLQNDQFGSDLVRLHITPFSPALFSSYLSPSVQASARDVSYHKVQTFPERPFGYVTMPRTEADRLKKKLNGSTLKGAKVRVEEAKPPKRKLDVDEDGTPEGKTERKKLKKEKRERGTLPGYELPEDRIVKRGWTEPSSEKRKDKKGRRDETEKKEKKSKTPDRENSRYTKEPELLFRAKVPPNGIDMSEPAAEEKKKKKKSKSTRGTEREVIVHEFEKTKRQAGFLQSSPVDGDAKVAHEFIDGKGWVDEDGHLIEDLKPRSEKKIQAHEIAEFIKDTRPKMKKEKRTQAQKTSLGTSIFAGLISESATSNKSKEKRKRKEETESSSDPTTESSDTSDGKVFENPELHRTHTNEPVESVEQEQFRTPHPLETLFKRPAVPTDRPRPINTSFSFFNPDENGSDVEDDTNPLTSQPPQTPFTEHVEFRRARSAAPTPDTAAVPRRFSFSKGAVDALDSDDEDPQGTPEYGKSANAGEGAGTMEPNGLESANGEAKDESPFAKWFWENRGDNNREWKRRRREAMKEKRNRENRRINRRVV